MQIVLTIIGIFLVCLGGVFILQTRRKSKNPITLKWKNLRKNHNAQYWAIIIYYFFLGIMFLLIAKKL